jgi:hypothetical protein
MSDFLLRMVSQAAGRNSGIKPRLPYQFAWQGPPGPRSSTGTAHIRDIDATSGFANAETFSFGPLPARAQQTALDAGQDATTRTTGEPAFVESSQASINSEPTMQPRTALWRRAAAIADLQDATLPPAAASALRDAESTFLRGPGSGDTKRHPELQSPTGFLASEEQPVVSQILTDDRDIERARALAFTSRTDLQVTKPTESSVPRPAPPPVSYRQRSEVPEEPSVEVKIGRVEVTFDAPAQPARVSPQLPRGFADYAALRRYSPQAWNRWRG